MGVEPKRRNILSKDRSTFPEPSYGYVLWIFVVPRDVPPFPGSPYVRQIRYFRKKEQYEPLTFCRKETNSVVTHVSVPVVRFVEVNSLVQSPFTIGVASPDLVVLTFPRPQIILGRKVTPLWLQHPRPVPLSFNLRVEPDFSLKSRLKSLGNKSKRMTKEYGLRLFRFTNLESRECKR